MATHNETAEQIMQWLAEEWGRCFAGVIESMADQKPTTVCDGITQPFLAAEGALNSEQEFSLGPTCTLRISVPELVWREAGTRVLQAAGIEEVGRDDALSTFHEVLSQTSSGVAQAIGTRLGREVNCAARLDKESFPEDTLGVALSINMPGGDIADYPVFVSPAPELVELLQGAEAPSVASPSPSVRPDQGAPAPSSISKTFDLLLGVHLPVSVSFGKTSMMVKEVLKLTTGSIVELNRAVTEPVEIIVNNCIIARGDVVVVAGNYGVRVREIVSREQRYQTGVRPPLPHGH